MFLGDSSVSIPYNFLTLDTVPHPFLPSIRKDCAPRLDERLLSLRLGVGFGEETTFEATRVRSTEPVVENLTLLFRSVRTG